MVNPRYGAAVVVTSDSCSRDKSKDKSGKYLLSELMKLPYINQAVLHIVPDEADEITKLLKSLVGCVQLIVTCGGTGLCPRDVTPETCQAIYEKCCPGISHALMSYSLKHSNYAALSRLTAGLIGQTMIVNFPGNLRACEQCFDCIRGFLQHALDQIVFQPELIEKTHLADSESINLPIVDALLKDSNKVDSTTYGSTASSTCIRSKLTTRSTFKAIDYFKCLETLRDLSDKNIFSIKNVRVFDDSGISELMGSYLASDIKSERIIPNKDVSMMDGYVLNISDDIANKIVSIGTINAFLVDSYEQFMDMRRSNSKPEKFFCYQVNTGGTLPESKYAIIPFEDCGPISPKGTVALNKISPNSYVRRRGSDMNTDFYMKKGSRIGPAEIATLLAMGQTEYPILTNAKIGILSTGDELVDIFQSRNSEDSNHVIDINGPLVRSLLRSRNFDCIDCGISVDDYSALSSKIKSSLVGCDILIVTGGASMGTCDHVKKIIVNELNGRIHFGRVNMKPGKPAAFATVSEHIGKCKYIFSLPGNPVSAYITTLVLVIPFLQYCMRRFINTEIPDGLSIIGTTITVEIGSILDLNNGEKSYEFDGRLEFVRSKLLQTNFGIGGGDKKEDSGIKSPNLVSVSAKQQSSRLLNILDFDCLIIVDPTQKGSRFLVGQTYRALLLKY